MTNNLFSKIYHDMVIFFYHRNFIILVNSVNITKTNTNNCFQFPFLFFCCKCLLHILMPDDRGRGLPHKALS